MNRLASIIVLFSAADQAACSQPEPPARLVLEGAFDVVVREDTFVPDDCFEGLDLPSYEPQGEFACVAFLSDFADNAPEQHYIQALNAQGWELASGASVQFWFERPLEGGDCSQALDLTFLPYGAPRDGEDPVDFAAYEHFQLLFELHRQPRCGDDRISVIMDNSQGE